MPLLTQMQLVCQFGSTCQKYINTFVNYFYTVFSLTQNRSIFSIRINIEKIREYCEQEIIDFDKTLSVCRINDVLPLDFISIYSYREGRSRA